MKRADQKRFHAWTPVYEKIRDEIGDKAFASGGKYMRDMERYVKKYVRRYRGTGRLTKFISLVKAHMEKGEKFIVVSDRLFLLVLAYHVSPLFPPHRSKGKVCADLLHLKMGVLAGTEIYGHKPTDKAREDTIEGLNEGDVQGIVMTDKVGGCGHNLTGANVMIFLGSLYSYPYEQQAVGIPIFPIELIVARICRPGQTRIPKIYIITDPDYEGDRMAFEIKAARQAEAELMSVKFDRQKGDYSAVEKVEALLGSEEEWQRWRELKAEQDRQETQRRIRIRVQRAMPVLGTVDRIRS
jgi:hypothetical protein